MDGEEPKRNRAITQYLRTFSRALASRMFGPAAKLNAGDDSSVMGAATAQPVEKYSSSNLSAGESMLMQQTRKPLKKRKRVLEAETGAPHRLDGEDRVTKNGNSDDVSEAIQTQACDRVEGKKPQSSHPRKKPRTGQCEGRGEAGRLVGRRLAVYWSGDDEFYEGVVTDSDKLNDHRVFIKYDDEEEEWVDLSTEKVKLLPITSKPKEKQSYLTDVEVGTEVSVWWPAEKEYFTATVSKINLSRRKPYFLKYEDGDSEWTDLAFRKFELI